MNEPEVQVLESEIQALGGYSAMLLNAESSAQAADSDFNAVMLVESTVSAPQGAMRAIESLINDRLGKYSTGVKYSPESLSIAFEADEAKPANAPAAAPAKEGNEIKDKTEEIKKQDAKISTDGKFKATIKKVWAAIKAAFIKVVQFITKVFKKMFGNIYKARRIAINYAKVFEGMGMTTKILAG